MQWDRVDIRTGEGEVVSAVAPVVVSASRATDIPAFHSQWLMNRLKAGYARWVNPFNGASQYVSFSRTRLLVFWSKNPEPLFPFLDEIEGMGLNYFFHITLNDYDHEKLEPNLPELARRVDSFISLSERIGRQRVLWRFDPLVISEEITPDKLIQKVNRVGSLIHQYTSRLTVSFLSLYPKVVQRSRRKAVTFHEVTDSQSQLIMAAVKQMAASWNLEFCTCAEKRDFSGLGISRGRCIDERHVAEVFSHDYELMRFLNPQWHPDLFGSDSFRKGLRDTGQRKECGCMKSKDIGRYNTCPHECVYCYANASSDRLRNFDRNCDLLGA
ncbi:MAG: DUF1848 domain-containing protein [Fibrobacterota bacterium]